jgi:single-strand DNA-binding protein
LWGKQAETAEKYLKKGSELAIEGKLINKNYTDKDGNKKYVTEIMVLDFLMLGGKSE